ncbi:hypothetical protein H0O02_02475 [Candidatus Micrarchaeota archaeon]|nr:hypothetical protein [Candidatus Micrarchaeota archaeon]
MDRFKKRDEVSGVYKITDRKTLPPPIKVGNKWTLPPSGVIIGSKPPQPYGNAAIPKIPPAPAPVKRLPMVEDDIIELKDLSGMLVDEEQESVLSKETQKLKAMLGGRAPQLNTTGIDYRDFVDGIDQDVKKIPGIKDSTTGNELKVLILKTKFGEFLFSNMPLPALRDHASELLNYENPRNRRMIIPLGEKKRLYIEEVVDRGNMGRNSGLIEVDAGYEISRTDISRLSDYELQMVLLSKIDKIEVERILNKLEQEMVLGGYGVIEVENMEVVDKELLDPHVAVRTTTGSEYWIFIREEGSIGKIFPLPNMTGLVEVNTGTSGAGNEKKYAVLRYGSEPVSVDPNLQ